MGEIRAVNFSNFPVVLDDTLPPNTCYMMPAEIYDLIEQAKRGDLHWDFVIEEVMDAAKDGRITIIKNIG